MNVGTKKSSAELSSRLTRLGVQALYLFGSRACGTEHAASDYDYAVLMAKSGHSKGDRLYQKLYKILCDISPRSAVNDVIDIIFLRDTNLELACHVVMQGRVLFSAKDLDRLTFEEHILKLYADFRPVLDFFDSAILERI